MNLVQLEFKLKFKVHEQIANKNSIQFEKEYACKTANEFV